MKFQLAISAAALLASGAAATLVDDILHTVSALPECAQKAFHDVYATPSDICDDLKDLAADALASDANIRSMVGKCQAGCSKDDFKILEDDEDAILGAIAGSCESRSSYRSSYSTTKDSYHTTTPSYHSTTTSYVTPTPAYSTKPAYSTPFYSKPADTYITKPAYTKPPAYTTPAHTKPAYTAPPKPTYTPSYSHKPTYTREPSSYAPKPTPTYYEATTEEYGYGYDEPEPTEYDHSEPEQSDAYGSYEEEGSSSYGYGDEEVEECSGVDYRCPTEGGAEFLQCDNGRWVAQECARGTVCIQELFTRMHSEPGRIADEDRGQQAYLRKLEYVRGMQEENCRLKGEICKSKDELRRSKAEVERLRRQLAEGKKSALEKEGGGKDAVPAATGDADEGAVFYDGPNDTALGQVASYLEELAAAEDVPATLAGQLEKSLHEF
ncbi:hypothetical protein HK101_010666 [Irineochytrium annulatum]|nr:hypothetical protein HK101_010666 [Irineochytrium annulatum]